VLPFSDINNYSQGRVATSLFWCDRIFNYHFIN